MAAFALFALCQAAVARCWTVWPALALDTAATLGIIVTLAARGLQTPSSPAEEVVNASPHRRTKVTLNLDAQLVLKAKLIAQRRSAEQGRTITLDSSQTSFPLSVAIMSGSG